MTRCLTRWWAPQDGVISFFIWGAIGLCFFNSQHFAIQRPLSIVTVQFPRAKQEMRKQLSARHASSSVVVM